MDQRRNAFFKLGDALAVTCELFINRVQASGDLIKAAIHIVAQQVKTAIHIAAQQVKTAIHIAAQVIDSLVLNVARKPHAAKQGQRDLYDGQEFGRNRHSAINLA